MDTNSLPMAPDLEVFPKVVHYAILAVLILWVSFVVLVIVIGVLG